jgi:predicted O-methyltransferase YrrM
MTTLEEPITFPDIYGKLEMPRSIVSVTQAMGELIYYILKQTGIKKTLEIGLCYGCSSAYILAATESVHYAMDPFQESLWNNLGLDNIQRMNLEKNLIFEQEYSHNVLPKFLAKRQTFDFVFIDGDHRYDSLMFDFYYSDLIVNKGGYILFDDAALPGHLAISRWIETNRLDYKKIELPNDREDYKRFVMYQKVSKDEREWDHFVEF